ncbi:hypothetical protein GUJ93_ZPchr0013g35671 [Zizania palustris]|uniref:DUF4283 domain-containing protein n=1 Tax=Zizania palustris TaxID=103762 RepID=A0A8J6C0E7_ZIZPA|nr:hypothetical protein GUJ93_ZPchr0013g35671 [Zizania palustris]
MFLILANVREFDKDMDVFGELQLVWVKALGVPLVMRSEKYVRRLAHLIGKPVEVDVSSLNKLGLVRVREVEFPQSDPPNRMSKPPSKDSDRNDKGKKKQDDVGEEDGMSEDGGKVDTPDCIEYEEESDSCQGIENQFVFPVGEHESSGSRDNLVKKANDNHEEKYILESLIENVVPLAQNSSLAIVPFCAMDYVNLLLDTDHQEKPVEMLPHDTSV